MHRFRWPLVDVGCFECSCSIHKDLVILLLFWCHSLWGHQTKICWLLVLDLPIVFQFPDPEDTFQIESNLQSFYIVQIFSIVIRFIRNLILLYLTEWRTRRLDISHHHWKSIVINVRVCLQIWIMKYRQYVVLRLIERMIWLALRISWPFHSLRNSSCFYLKKSDRLVCFVLIARLFLFPL